MVLDDFVGEGQPEPLIGILPARTLAFHPRRNPAAIHHSFTEVWYKSHVT
jgi:hypothetical protein